MGADIKVSRIQKRGQVTIPIEIRQKLHLEEGDLVAFIETKEGVVLTPQEAVLTATRNKVDESPVTSEGPSIVKQTAGIFRRRQDGAIDFELARQAFIDHFAQQANGEATDNRT